MMVGSDVAKDEGFCRTLGGTRRPLLRMPFIAEMCRHIRIGLHTG